MKTPLVVDANPIISALIGGASREIFFSKNFRFATAEFTVEEVRKFIPYILLKNLKSPRWRLKKPLIFCH